MHDVKWLHHILWLSFIKFFYSQHAFQHENRRKKFKANPYLYQWGINMVFFKQLSINHHNRYSMHLYESYMWSSCHFFPQNSKNQPSNHIFSTPVKIWFSYQLNIISKTISIPSWYRYGFWKNISKSSRNHTLKHVSNTDRIPILGCQVIS